MNDADMNGNWILYVKTRCPWCVEAVAWLNKRNLAYREVDVSRDPAAFSEMVRLSGQRSAPTLSIDGGRLLLPDFDTGQLEVFLKKNGLLTA